MAPRVVGPGKVLSPTEIATFAVVVGFQRHFGPATTGQQQTQGSDAAIMTAIALAESGGASNIVSDTDDWGLWQINRKTWEGKIPAIKFPFANHLAESGSVTDPLTNAMAAKYVYDQQGFAAWSTYTSKEYLNHYLTAVSAVTNLPPTVVPGGITNPKGSEETKTLLQSYWDNLWGGFGKFGTSVLWVGGGVLVVALGMIFLIKMEMAKEGAVA